MTTTSTRIRLFAIAASVTITATLFQSVALLAGQPVAEQSARVSQPEVTRLASR